MRPSNSATWLSIRSQELSSLLPLSPTAPIGATRELKKTWGKAARKNFMCVPVIYCCVTSIHKHCRLRPPRVTSCDSLSDPRMLPLGERICFTCRGMKSVFGDQKDSCGRDQLCVTLTHFPAPGAPRRPAFPPTPAPSCCPRGWCW